MNAASLPPSPSKVTATMTTKEDPVAVIERGGLRLGTAADAGEVCVTSRSKRGISAEMFRFYVRTQGAPGPYQVRDPITRKLVAARDEEGRELFDLDAVAEWNANRPGPGARAGRPVKWTEMRRDLMVGARDRKLWLTADTGRPLHADMELTPRHVQRIGELVTAGLLRAPGGDRGGRYRLTKAGQKWLAEHDVPDPTPCLT